MNSFLSISFAFLFLIKGIIPSVDLSCELKKLPNLFEHYQEHKACNNGSFLNFLVNDFFHGGTLGQDHDDSEHDNLPLHGNHNCCHPSTFYANAQQFSIAVYSSNGLQSFAFYYNSFSSLFPDFPSQPPQA